MAGEYLLNPKYPEKLRFWEDKNHWWHPVNLDEPDPYQHLLKEKTPNWVLEQRNKREKYQATKHNYKNGKIHA